MLDKIATAHIHCYLAHLKWELFHQFADEFMGTKVEHVQADLHSLFIKNTSCILKARKFQRKAEGLPWDIHMSLSFFRKPKPFDDWLGVQFAHEICLATSAQSYTNVPPEVGTPSADFHWQLSFYPAPNQEIISELVKLQEVEDEHYIELEKQEVDLRNFELFQTQLPYR
ncbi:MAG: hypothetical protein AAF696_13435 [Bacteroidota bacterium]